VNARIQEPKPCIVCGKTMHPEDYKTPKHFDLTKSCSMVCGGAARSPAAHWDRLMAYEVTDAMEFEEIARVAGVSRQRIWDVYQIAMRKLTRNVRVLAELREWK